MLHNINHSKPSNLQESLRSVNLCLGLVKDRHALLVLFLGLQEARLEQAATGAAGGTSSRGKTKLTAEDIR